MGRNSTRGSLGLLLDHANPVSMLTKSPMVVRDVDLLAQIARETSAQIRQGVSSVYVKQIGQ